jgi:hypothetical protein
MGESVKYKCAFLVLATLGAGQLRADTVNYGSTGSIQTYSVPTTGVYNITAAGAQGGQSLYEGVSGGLGAQVGGSISLTAGETLQIVVGGQGVSYTHGGGGGGGTFIFVTGQSDPLLVAGGGGGTGFSAMGEDGLATEGGTSGVSGAGGTGYGGTANTNLYNDAAGGAGWLGNGADDYSPGTGGMGPPTFTGGTDPLGDGGFGGGGAAGDASGGGGGGYSGGAGGPGSYEAGAGGGSYINALFTDTTAIGGATSGNGYVSITENTVVVPLPTAACEGLGLIFGLGVIGGFRHRNNTKGPGFNG